MTTFMLAALGLALAPRNGDAVGQAEPEIASVCYRCLTVEVEAPNTGSFDIVVGARDDSFTQSQPFVNQESDRPLTAALCGDCETTTSTTGTHVPALPRPVIRQYICDASGVVGYRNTAAGDGGNK